MKTVFWFACVLILTLTSCKKENRWIAEIPEKQPELKFTDISKDFFDTQIPLEKLQTEYPFFFDPNTKPEVWERQRRDTAEIAIYQNVKKVFEKSDYKTKMTKMFSYFNKYFPNELIPGIYTYSSGLQNIYEDAVLYGRKEGMLFIALDGFLGENNEWYKKEKVFPYMAQDMNPENLVPRVVTTIGNQIVPFNPRQQTFIDLMVDEGKKLILADALIPEASDELKIGYTKEQLDWAKQNEEEIWNYFIEENLIFNSDKSNAERFIKPGPFSKFGNEIETDSPGRIGVWTGWQICRKYLDKHPKISLNEFLNIDNQTIFKDSKYKPSK